MNISSKLWVIKKSFVSRFLTFLLILILYHCILLQRFFYPGLAFFHCSLSWIKFYLLNRSVDVNIQNSKSPVLQLVYGVPEGSVFGHLLFILYTPPFSTVISNSAANHPLYADDTQLLLSFSALNFSHNITHLENTITNVSNWRSSNFLSLSPSKTEFLISGPPQQFSKLHNTTIHPGVNMGSFCNGNSTIGERPSVWPKAVLRVAPRGGRPLPLWSSGVEKCFIIASKFLYFGVR